MLHLLLPKAHAFCFSSAVPHSQVPQLLQCKDTSCQTNFSRVLDSKFPSVQVIHFAAFHLHKQGLYSNSLPETRAGKISNTNRKQRPVLQYPEAGWLFSSCNINTGDHEAPATIFSISTQVCSLGSLIHTVWQPPSYAARNCSTSREKPDSSTGVANQMLINTL